ncbi:hypothetical protein P2318_02845 [Myxococcaceae bacterium GXIMD 01537]
MKSTSYSPGLAPLPDLRADLMVRPDHVRVRFQFSLEAESADQGVPPLKDASQGLLTRARDATRADVKLRLLDVRFGPGESRKLRLPEDEDRSTVTVDGELELPLTPELDFWERGARLAALMRVCQEHTRDARDEKSRPRVRFGPPVPRIAQPESYRAELLGRLRTRLREFQSTLAPAEVPVRPAQCTPPGPVAQTPFSLEEVGLSLHLVWRTGAKLDTEAQGSWE